MSVEKLTISLEPELAEQVRESAAGNVSGWIAEAARTRLRQLQARKLLDEYEAEHGEIDESELEQARRAWPDSP